MALGIGNPKQDIKDSIIGRVSETAKLVIHDFRKCAREPVMNNEQNIANNNNIANQGALNRLQDDDDGPEMLPGERRLTFEVQFNPSDLSLNASALAINKQSVHLNNAGAANVNMDASSAVINLNVNLIFDKMNEADAFLFETGTSGLAGVGTAVATAVATAKGKLTGEHPFSVKPEVEALMAALRSPHTRIVDFEWNDFTFSGQLQYIQVKYTLFSPLGHPVRAMVMIRMKREASPNDSWAEDFDATFSGDGGQVRSLTQQHGMLNF